MEVSVTLATSMKSPIGLVEVLPDDALVRSVVDARGIHECVDVIEPHDQYSLFK